MLASVYRTQSYPPQTVFVFNQRVCIPHCWWHNPNSQSYECEYSLLKSTASARLVCLWRSLFGHAHRAYAHHTAPGAVATAAAVYLAHPEQQHQTGRTSAVPVHQGGSKTATVRE
jgi:hypothetical protein